MYLQSVNHPVLQLLDASPASFVGEDIEISLALLSNYASKKHLNRKADLLSHAYQKLGLLITSANRAQREATSLFGVPLKNRDRIFYTSESPEASKVLAFLRQWIIETKVRGVLMYEKRGAATKFIGKSLDERKKATRVTNVTAIDLNWKPFASANLDAHLTKMSDPDIGRKKEFSRATIEGLSDHFAFDEALLQTLEPLDSEDSLQDVPLTEFVNQYEYTLSQEELQALHEEREKKKKARAAGIPVTEAERGRGRGRGRGRPRKEPPSQPPSHPPGKRPRGRPRGAKNKPKKVRGLPTPLEAATESISMFSSSLPTTVFDSRDDDDEEDNRFAFLCFVPIIKHV